MREWLFVISNPSIPNMVKITHSEDHPEVIIRTFDVSGSAPLLYQLAYKILLRNDCYHILQNIRECLWSDHRSLAHGWYRETAQELIPLIRSEIAFFIIDKLRIALKSNREDLNYDTLIQTIGSVIILETEPSLGKITGTFEAREISKIIANILKTNDWMNSPWGNRISGNNNRLSNVIP